MNKIDSSKDRNLSNSDLCISEEKRFAPRNPKSYSAWDLGASETPWGGGRGPKPLYRKQIGSKVCKGFPGELFSHPGGEGTGACRVAPPEPKLRTSP